MQANLLCIEITEQLALTNTQSNLATLETLKKLGAAVSLDDFGVGYSSLGYIKKFGPRSLKLDRSLITDVTTNLEDAVIVRAVVAMSKQLGIQVVAEGVESDEARLFLRDIGCDHAQGYFFARPRDDKAFLKWLETNPPLAV